MIMEYICKLQQCFVLHNSAVLSVKLQVFLHFSCLVRLFLNHVYVALRENRANKQSFSEDLRIEQLWIFSPNYVILTLDSASGFSPVDVAQLVDSMNGLHQFRHIELSHGLIKLILVSV